MTKFVGFWTNIHSYSKNDSNEDKKAKGKKKSQKENLNLKIMKTVKKQLNLRMK